MIIFDVCRFVISAQGFAWCFEFTGARDVKTRKLKQFRILLRFLYTHQEHQFSAWAEKVFHSVNFSVITCGIWLPVSVHRNLLEFLLRWRRAIRFGEQPISSSRNRRPEVLSVVQSIVQSFFTHIQLGQILGFKTMPKGMPKRPVPDLGATVRLRSFDPRQEPVNTEGRLSASG